VEKCISFIKILKCHRKYTRNYCNNCNDVRMLWSKYIVGGFPNENIRAGSNEKSCKMSAPLKPSGPLSW
jgi:hypothetical protein